MGSSGDFGLCVVFLLLAVVGGMGWVFYFYSLRRLKVSAAAPP